MSSEKKSFVAENGITLGVAILALLVIFGVGLPRWLADDAEAAHSGEPIELPTKLSGGFKADDSEQTAASIDKQRDAMSDALGTPASITQYMKGQDALLVQAVRGPGEAALSPTGAEYSTVDDAVCLSYQSFVTCSRTSDTLTVQVTAVDEEQAAKYAGEVFDEVGP